MLCRSRGWVTISSLYTEVEIAYQKVGDGHPLRLWRCVTEVEAPPIEVVDFIKDNRLQWDSSFIDGTVIRVIDDKNDIYYYSIKGVRKTAFTVLRYVKIKYLNIGIHNYKSILGLYIPICLEELALL